MNRILALCFVVIVLVSTSGCANGPLRRFFAGSPCNTCNPPLGLFRGLGSNSVNRCDSGQCSPLVDHSFGSGGTIETGYDLNSGGVITGIAPYDQSGMDVYGSGTTNSFIVPPNPRPNGQ